MIIENETYNEYKTYGYSVAYIARSYYHLGPGTRGEIENNLRGKNIVVTGTNRFGEIQQKEGMLSGFERRGDNYYVILSEGTFMFKRIFSIIKMDWWNNYEGLVEERMKETRERNEKRRDDLDKVLSNLYDEKGLPANAIFDEDLKGELRLTYHNKVFKARIGHKDKYRITFIDENHGVILTVYKDIPNTAITYIRERRESDKKVVEKNLLNFNNNNNMTNSNLEKLVLDTYLTTERKDKIAQIMIDNKRDIIKQEKIVKKAQDNINMLTHNRNILSQAYEQGDIETLDEFLK